MKHNVSPLKQAMFMVNAPVAPADGILDLLKKELKTSLTNLNVARAQKSEGLPLEGHIKHDVPQLIHSLQIQIPGSEHFIRRYTFRVEIKMPDNSKYCCRTARRLHWHTHEDLQSKLL